MNRALKLGIVFLVALVPFAPIILQSELTLLYRDLINSFYPSKFFWSQVVRSEGQLPFWDFFTMGGKAYLADLNQNPLWPLNFLLLLFPQENLARGFFWFIAVHFSLLAASTYYLFFSLRSKLALALALLYSWSGACLMTMHMPNILMGLIATSLAIAFWHRWLESRRWPYIFLLSMAWACPIYGGDPQFSYLLLPFLLVWSLTYPTKLSKTLWTLAAVFVLGLLFSAPQLLPSLAYAQDSTRGLRLSLAEAEVWSLHPWRILEWFFPLYFGNIHPQYEYWAPFQENVSTKLPFLYAIFLGPAAWALVSLAPGRPWSKRAKFSLGLAIFFLLLSLGAYAPVHQFFVTYVPFWSGYRYPQRFMLWANLCMFLFLSETFSLRRISSKRFLVVIMVFCVLGLVAFALTPPDFRLGVLQQSILPTLAIIGLVLYFLWRSLGQIGPVFLSGILILSGVFFALPHVWPQRSAILTPNRFVGDFSAQVAKDADFFRKGGARRLFVRDEFIKSYDVTKSRGDLTYPERSALFSIEQMGCNTSVIYGFENIFGYFSLLPRSRASFWLALKENQDRLLDWQGVRYLSTRARDSQVILGLRPKALPYLYAPSVVIGADDYEGVIARMRLSDPSADFALSEDSITKNYVRADVELLERSSRHLKVRVTPSQSGAVFLVRNESIHSDWEVLGAKVLRVNGWAMGVEVQGEKDRPIEVTWRFIPKSFYLGLAGLGAWILMAFFACIAGVFRRPANLPKV